MNGFGDGPRCTPTLDGDVLYALGAHGDLQCLSQENGSERWKLNILEEFGGQNIGWGISESPLVMGDRVIVTPGGTGATIVALDKNNGRTIWRSRDPNSTDAEQAAYASPQQITVVTLSRSSPSPAKELSACRRLMQVPVALRSDGQRHR